MGWGPRLDGDVETDAPGHDFCVEIPGSDISLGSGEIAVQPTFLGGHFLGNVLGEIWQDSTSMDPQVTAPWPRLRDVGVRIGIVSLAARLGWEILDLASGICLQFADAGGLSGRRQWTMAVGAASSESCPTHG